MTEFDFWTYRQPVGHSKSRSVRDGSAPHVERWAYAPIVDGVSLRANCVSGFASRDEAEAHARAALAKVDA